MTATEAFRDAAIAWAVRGDEDARGAATRLAGDIASVILVEGVSDAAAIEGFAPRSGRDLARARVSVISMGGVTNIRKFLGILSPLGIPTAGLCDANEEHVFRRALEGAGFGVIESRARMAELGFFVCVDDLEDEFIRALGPQRIEGIMDEQGDLPAFRTFQNQPAQRDRSLDRQLRRFLGTTAGRKQRYAKILVEAEPLRAPQPLDDVLRFLD